MDRMPQPMISVHELEKHFNGSHAVRGLSVEIHAGEFFGLLGPNGAGKSTTIGMLTGLIKPTKGTIFIDGVPFPARSRETQSKLGFVPQDFAFYPTMSAWENLNFFGRIYGLSGERLKRRREEVLAAVALSDRALQAVATFSNGMKRRLNLAIALLHEPPILVLDEPTVGVDAHSRHMLLSRLKELNRDGVTILYTTHYVEEAQRLCDRVAIMDHGIIVAEDSPAVLIQEFGRGGIRIEFSQTVNQEFLDRLTRLGEVKLMGGNQREVHLRTDQTESALRRTIELAEKEKVSFNTINILEDDLESVFLHLTGRYLRAQSQDS
jgi:ABC-2 type transport system ATP-binding protein